MNKEVITILQKIYKQYGEEIIQDKKKLESYFSDLLAQYPREKRLLTIAAREELFVNILGDIKANELNKKNIYVNLISSLYAIEGTIAVEIVEVIYYALSNGNLVFNTENNISKLPKPVNSKYVSVLDTDVNPNETKQSKGGQAEKCNDAPIFVDEEHKQNLRPKKNIRLFQNIDAYDDELKLIKGIKPWQPTVAKNTQSSDVKKTETVIRNLDEYDDELKQMEKNKNNKKNNSWFF